MVLDYSERKPVGKNRPRKQPVGIFVLILLGAVAISYVLGLTTGWFLFKSRDKAMQGRMAAATSGQTGGGAAPVSQAPFVNPEATAPKGGDPPLTFYETLPKGGKAVIGSGLNPKKTDAQPAPQQAANVPPPPTAPAAAKHEAPKEKAPLPTDQPKKVAAPPADASGTFCVQVASSQDRKDADALRVKLAEKGFNAYVVESRIKDKGTWYRVRVGRHLSQKVAGELAGKAGKGALVIPE
jgi:cell division septation protein DedD